MPRQLRLMSPKPGTGKTSASRRGWDTAITNDDTPLRDIANPIPAASDMGQNWRPILSGGPAIPRGHPRRVRNRVVTHLTKDCFDPTPCFRWMAGLARRIPPVRHLTTARPEKGEG